MEQLKHTTVILPNAEIESLKKQIAQLTAERDDFETQLIAAKLKIEKMKLIEYDKWIRLKDKFPEYNINVLALSKKGKIRIACVGSDGELDNFELEIDNGEDYYTHWRYLPNKLG